MSAYSRLHIENLKSLICSVKYATLDSLFIRTGKISVWERWSRHKVVVVNRGNCMKCYEYRIWIEITLHKSNHVCFLKAFSLKNFLHFISDDNYWVWPNTICNGTFKRRLSMVQKIVRGMVPRLFLIRILHLFHCSQCSIQLHLQLLKVSKSWKPRFLSVQNNGFIGLAKAPCN